jgi:prevent-host-death family protein
MKTFAVADARKHFSEILAAVEAGEDVMITRRGKSVARLIPAPARSAADVFEPLWDQRFEDVVLPEDPVPEPVEALD